MKAMLAKLLAAVAMAAKDLVGPAPVALNLPPLGAMM
jgi:hypothetical protein